VPIARRIAVFVLTSALFTTFGATVLRAQAPTTRPSKSQPSPVGWWDDAFEEPRTTLKALLASPIRYRGRVVRIDVQFSGVRPSPEAFHTKFKADAWLNFAAWGDEARLWLPADARADHAFFFIPRKSADVAALRDAPRYARLRLRARVDDSIQGAPWIEVLGATELQGRMTEASLLRLERATKLKDARRFLAAAEEFQIADDAVLPASVRAVVHFERATCLESAGDVRRALGAIAEARLFAEDDVVVASAYARLRGAMHAYGPDSERPATSITTAPASRPSSK
jgi:hypothetical protein